MKKRAFNFLLSTTLAFSLISVSTAAPKKADACYPAYKCMSKSILPTSYTLMFSNKDRSKGAFIGITAVSAGGLIPGVGIPSFLSATALGVKELYGYASYRSYVKRNTKTGKIGIIKTVHYKEKNYKGKTKTTYDEW
jgi:hypothetical protein